MISGLSRLFFYFYPRPPRGGRHSTSGSRERKSLFLSTPSARRATYHSGVVYVFISISIHALREEGDLSAKQVLTLSLYFYPRPPRGGRPTRAPKHTERGYISIHALREEGDVAPIAVLRSSVLFLSTPSARRATSGFGYPRASSINFYPRPPRGGRPKLSMPLSCSSIFLSTPSARRATACVRAGSQND